MINFDRSTSLDEEKLYRTTQKEKIRQALAPHNVAINAAKIPLIPTYAGYKAGQKIGSNLNPILIVPASIAGGVGGSYIAAKLFKQIGKFGPKMTLRKKLGLAGLGALAGGTALSIANQMSDVNNQYVKDLANRRTELVPSRYYLVEEITKTDVKLVGSPRGYTSKQEAITVAEEIEARSKYSIHCLLGSTAVKNWPSKFRLMDYDD